MRTQFIVCRVVAAQLNSRVSDLVATQGLRKACTVDAPEVQETPYQSADVAALQQKVVDLSVELRDVRREMGGQAMPSTVPAGAHQLQVHLTLLMPCADSMLAAHSCVCTDTANPEFNARITM